MKYRPYASTEHGILMLSSVLNSERAIQVNITIMRAFVRLRQMLATNANLERRLNDLERKYDSQFKVVFDAIRQLMTPPEKPPKKIGFQLKEKRSPYLAKNRIDKFLVPDSGPETYDPEFGQSLANFVPWREIGLWPFAHYDASDILHGKMDHVEFRDFIFGMLFIRSCSGVFEEERETEATA